MGKGDLWDDSALVNAFDTAMSKFKGMHKTNGRYEENLTGFGDANEQSQALGKPAADGGSGETERCVEGLETDKGSSHLLLIATKSEDPETIISAADEQRTLEVQAYNEHVQGSSSIQTQDPGHSLPESQDNGNHLRESQDNGDYLQESQDNGNYLPESQGVDDYYQLCKESLELEEKRLQLWYRFQQYNGNWNYQDPTNASYGGGSTTHESLAPEQGSLSTAALPCCPYTCPSSMASSTSLASCSQCGPCFGVHTGPKVGINAGQPPAITESDIVREGMEAAEKVMSVLNLKPSDSGVDIGTCSGKDTSTTSMDVSDVLKAWYTAGLYTGKYLAEQSLIRKQDD